MMPSFRVSGRDRPSNAAGTRRGAFSAQKPAVVRKFMPRLLQSSLHIGQEEDP